MARLVRAGQELRHFRVHFAQKPGELGARSGVDTPMLSPQRPRRNIVSDLDLQFHGVRFLTRASFLLIMVMASVGNQADNEARAKGLMSVRIEAPSMLLGTHACMQPDAQDVPDEPEPEKPPCPRSGK